MRKRESQRGVFDLREKATGLVCDEADSRYEMGEMVTCNVSMIREEE